MTNCECELGAIQGIKVKLIDAFPLQQSHLLDGNAGGDQFSRVRVIFETVESIVQPARHRGAALFGEARQLRKARDRQNARDDRCFDASDCAAITKPEIRVNIKKELRDRARRALRSSCP